MRYVIIGNGVAGITAAETIRQYDQEAGITLIGDESAVPYCRPMISLVLEGANAPEKLPIRGSRFYDELNIQAVLGNRVTGIDVEKRTVAVGGSSCGFDRLLIATGADAADHREHERGEIADRGAQRGGGSDLCGGAGSGKGGRFDPSPHRKQACETGTSGTGGMS